ncbi:MAG: hypothetical protein JST54_24065 [Deltaproteobacteria bacterium]|nr:hypothetical protein [Deltaproteobacteria bacterium]
MRSLKPHLAVGLFLVAALPAPPQLERAAEDAHFGLPRIHIIGDEAYDSGRWVDLIIAADALPDSGSPQKQPWNAYWWPYKRGGLTRRWISPNEPSPIEKMDLVTGHASQGLDWEIRSHPANVDWGGQCDGYAIASVLEPEPRFPVLHDGVCFASGDVQGLLGAIYMGDMTGQRVDVLGRDAFVNARSDSDLTPALFHIALTNVMGRLSQGLYIDIGKHGEIYNKPVASYSLKTKRIGNRLEITTTLNVVRYFTEPKVTATDKKLVCAPMVLTYELELDNYGFIRTDRGEWTGASAGYHPSSMKIPRGSPVKLPTANPFIDMDLVRTLAARSAAATEPECLPDKMHRAPQPKVEEDPP